MSKRKLRHEESLDSVEGNDVKRFHAATENLSEVYIRLSSICMQLFYKVL